MQEVPKADQCGMDYVQADLHRGSCSAPEIVSGSPESPTSVVEQELDGQTCARSSRGSTIGIELIINLPSNGSDYIGVQNFLALSMLIRTLGILKVFNSERST
jgi:hypothetical protein